jgi:hypothetical protein
MVYLHAKNVPKISLLVYFGKPWNGKVGILYGHLVFLWSFGVFCGNWVIFFQFLYVEPRKIWQPCFHPGKNVSCQGDIKVIKVVFSEQEKNSEKYTAGKK